MAFALFAAWAAAVGPVRADLYGDWPVVTNAAAARRDVFANPTRKVRFSFDAEVSFPHRAGFPYLAVNDGSGAMLMIVGDDLAAHAFSPGDRLRIYGRATETDPVISDAFGETVTLLRRGTNHVSFVRRLSGDQLARGDGDCAPVAFSGILTSCFTDDADPHFLCLIVEDNGVSVYCTILSSANRGEGQISRLVGQCVSVTGLCHPSPPSPRLHAGRVVFVQDPSDIRLAPERADKVFDAPDIGQLRNRQISELVGLGRHRTAGRVVTAFPDGNVILRSATDTVLHVRLAGTGLPRIGSSVEVLGVPTPDLYHINLVRAIWRYCDAPCGAASAGDALSSRDLHGKRIHPNCLGRLVRVVGKLVSVQASHDRYAQLFVDDGAMLVKAFARADGDLPAALAPGCTVEVTGVCVLETDAASGRDGYASIRGFFIAPAEGRTVRVLETPSWWTPFRLFVTLAVVLALAIAVGIWNLLLKATVRRKSREIEQEIAKSITADIKVYERTRLAVELHDALSQTLTGVSMEIRAADKALSASPDNCRGHLARAERTVDACRGELRDCIWDLRNNAMDDPDMNTAIRRTLAPHLGSAALSVRFPIRRDRFSDNTTHAILRIVRELTVNAIRHGHATAVRVAGTIENGKFLFSVRDNGCGFDPDAGPGISEGHFGLQGIRERVDRFEGDVEIVSAKGKGTKVTVILSIPKGDSE